MFLGISNRGTVSRRRKSYVFGTEPEISKNFKPRFRELKSSDWRSVCCYEFVVMRGRVRTWRFWIFQSKLLSVKRRIATFLVSESLAVRVSRRVLEPRLLVR
ncbi:hypothetical protein LINPERHAP1_LOCUS15709 [Linum perenne]